MEGEDGQVAVRAVMGYLTTEWGSSKVATGRTKDSSPIALFGVLGLDGVGDRPQKVRIGPVSRRRQSVYGPHQVHMIV